MTLFAQVRVYRRLENFSHAVDPEGPEIGWVVNEGEGDQVIVAGFAADGSTFSVIGKLSDLQTKPQSQASPRATEGPQTATASSASPTVNPVPAGNPSVVPAAAAVTPPVVDEVVK